MATDLQCHRVSSVGYNRDKERSEESQKGTEVDVLWHHPTLMTLWNRMEPNYIRPFKIIDSSVVSVLDDLHGYLTTPPDTAVSSFYDESQLTLTRNYVIGVTMLTNVSSQCRTTLHFVNGTLTSPNYLNNITVLLITSPSH